MEKDRSEILYSMALTRISHFSLAGMLHLYRTLGSATAIVEHRNDIRDIVPDVRPQLVEAIKDLDEPLRRAEIELEYDMSNGITPFCMNDERYPQRLKECDDAPLVLFYKGTADLNRLHVIDIVGTRHSTQYGQDLVHRFLADLRQFSQDILVVSGLAYGIDICVHRESLANGYETVGVLAHGLDDLYPASHRKTAEQMTRQGGLLTEFMTQTNADKRNFVRRNRIVAGLSDACILVESAVKGGGLITAGISRSYNRDVFAFPGAVGVKSSEGCNNLIRDNAAGLITCAEDFMKAMGWDDCRNQEEIRKKGIEQELFPSVTPEEESVVAVLQRADMQINMLAVQANMPISHLTSVLFNLEMKGIVKQLAGGMYHLLMR